MMKRATDNIERTFAISPAHLTVATREWLE